MGPVQNQNSYNPDNWGVSSVDIKRIDQQQELKEKGYSIVSGIFATIVAGLLTAYYNPTIAPLLFSVVGSTGAMVATALGVGGFGGLVGLATYYTIHKTNNVSQEVFKNIQDSGKDHLLDTQELKNTIRVLEDSKKDRELKQLFNTMSPKQIHGLSVDPDAKKYESYFSGIENFEKLTTSPPQSLLKEDPYYRALYVERRAKEKKQIPEDVFKLDFPNIVANIPKEETPLGSKQVLILGLNGQTRTIEGKFILRYLNQNTMKRLEEKKQLEVEENLNDLGKVFDILEGKSTISTPEELEQVVSLADKWGMKDLIKDIYGLIQNRKDLFSDDKKLNSFIDKYPLLAKQRRLLANSDK